MAGEVRMTARISAGPPRRVTVSSWRQGMWEEGGGGRRDGNTLPRAESEVPGDAKYMGQLESSCI